MNLCDNGNMFTEMPIEENVGGIKEDSTVIDLDLDIGKLSVSLSSMPYAADQSSISMVKSDASDAGLPSVFESICINECIEPRDSVARDIKSDAFDLIGQADLSAERTDEGEDTSKVDSCDSASIADPSTQGIGEAKILVDVDKICQQSHSLIVYTSSRRRSMRTAKSNQNNKSQKPPKCRSIANKNSVFDFSSLQILKRSRTSFSRARSSVWGNLGNILPAIEENSGLDINLGDEKNLRRVSRGTEKNKAIRDQTSGKSTGKGCIPTRHISLKVRIGNKSCSVDNAYQNFSALGKDIPDLTDTMGNKLAEKGSVVSPCERKLEKLMSSDASAHVEVRATIDDQPFDFREVRSLKEGDNSGGSTEIRCSDVGTSPDSEVINTVPDALLCEKGLPDLQDSSIVSKTCVSTTDNSSLILSPKHSKKGKKKDKLHQGGNFMLKKNLTGAETRNNGIEPVYIQDVTNLSSAQTKSKRGKKKDKPRGLGNSSVESNLTGLETTNNSNAPADFGVGQKVGDVSYCCDASMTSTAKPHLNGAEMDLCSGLVDASASSNLQVCDTLIPCSNGKKLPKPRAKGGSKGKSRVFLYEEDKASEKDNKKSGDGKLLVSRKVAASGDLNGVASIQAGNQTPSALSNDLSGPVNRLPFSSDGLREQYDPPRNAWVLCDECQKWRRIPATLADQINETECEWTCQDNCDGNFADCSIPQEKSDSEINEELGLSDASCEEDACGTDLKFIQDPSNTAQQSYWSLIKSNLFLSRSRKTQTIDEVMVCHCKPPSDGRMGCGEKCLNRMLNIECVHGTCPCGERCSNQQFQKRNYAKLTWFRCGKKGYGLQALEDIPEGHFLIEYVGEVLDVRAYEARQKEYAMNGHKHFYFMTLNGSEVIDACSKGNLGRFINHSCDPNCRTEKWMVNGEVCIGLFALRDIKKDEEITFDYNFVRVFGAAAKKCVCDSPNCRGYIGGDLTNSEVIAQDDSDDEYPEPVMICENGEMNEDWNEIMSNTFNDREIESSAIEPPQNISSMKKLNCAGDENKSESRSSEFSPKKMEGVNSEQVAETREGFGVDNSVGYTFAAHVDEKVTMNNIAGESLKGSEPAVHKIESEVIWSRMQLSSKLMDGSLLSDRIANTSQEQVFNVSRSKSFPDKVECKRKIKYASQGRKDGQAKSDFVAKINRSLSSSKKGKPKMNVLNGKVPPDEDKLSAAQHKSKKIPEHSLNNHVEAVEEKLNELLDPEGGISKRKDASRGYLKLLFLTAATGNNGHGEAIQSNRDLSMILDALLKTKSRKVLVDIINRNGLQMLHNIMKRSRKEFTKTPILRKLLKVLEYLATREILTLEHITGGPPCPGVESFKDSVLTLTEHTDKQVYQIARNFRDKWIPRSFRKNCCMERDDARIGFHQHSSHGGLSVSYDNRSDQGGKPMEIRNFLEPQSVAASGTTETSTLDLSASGGSCGTNEPRTRKRKSRWDTPPVEYPNLRTRTNLVGDTKLDIDDDIPPGFSSPCNGPMVPSIASSTAINNQEREMQIKKHAHNTVLGDPQFRFVARMPLSYGVPLSILQQYGIHKAETSESWAVGPGVPFHSFPPLPPRSSGEVDRSTSTATCASLSEEPMGKDGQCRDTGVTNQTDQQHTQICNIDPLEKNGPVTNDCPDFQQGGSCSLGRKYFRQQKQNHLKLAPPWVRMRNGWGITGNNTRNGFPGVGLANGQNDFRNSYNSNEVYRREF